MATGIKNPFTKPKKNFVSSTGKTPYNTEYRAKSKGDIRLDGGAFIILLRDAEIDDIPERLGDLFAELAEKYRTELAKNGIAICADYPDIPAWKDCRALTKAHMTLPTPKGNLYICSEVDNDQDVAFNLLGHALLQIPARAAMAKHNTKLIIRRT